MDPLYPLHRLSIHGTGPVLLQRTPAEPGRPRRARPGFFPSIFGKGNPLPGYDFPVSFQKGDLFERGVRARRRIVWIRLLLLSLNRSSRKKEECKYHRMDLYRLFEHRAG